ncbi:MAG: hypothetical protein HY289_06295 [Planctomycetes bacterium]|nr:hypothetical protein [Planctomycetota bacterium]
MKKIAFLTLLASLYFTVNADAQTRRPFFQRPLVQQILSNPITLPLGLFFPGAPNITIGGGGATAEAKITVPKAVSDNLDQTEANLKDARSRTEKLMQKNGISTTTTPAVSGGSTGVVSGLSQADLDALREKLGLPKR